MEFQIIKNQKYASDIIDALIEKAGFPMEDAVSLVSKIPNAPTIEAEPVRHGKWIAQDETYTRYFCSECKDRNHQGHEKFCPNCGAKMDLK